MVYSYDRFRYTLFLGPIVIIVGFLTGLISSDAAAAMRSGPRIPHTINEALESLCYTQAGGVYWAKFGVGSSVTYRIIDVQGDSTVENNIKMTLVARNDSRVKIMLEPGGELNLDLVDILHDEAEKTFFTRGRSSIGNKSYDVESWGIITDVEYKPGRIFKTYYNVYWVAADVPNGVMLKHTNVVMPEDPSFSEETDERLTDVNVPIIAVGQKLNCYCIEKKESFYYEVTHEMRICYSFNIPGGMVTSQSRDLKGQKEIGRGNIEVVDFKVEPIRRNKEGWLDFETP